MDSKIVDQKLRDIFYTMFPNLSELNDNSSSKDIIAWDSLRHVMLITEIENQFEIKFDLDEMLSMKTFGDIRQNIASKL